MTRRFLDSNIGQLHARVNEAGTGVPLLMLHAAPGSALMLSALQQRIERHSLAVDLPGMGDSAELAPLDHEATIADFTAPIAEMANALWPTGFDVYGTLSGARVALALANQSGSLVRRVVLDGIGIPKAEQLPALLERYAPAFAPDINGAHFLNTFLLCRDQYLFYPWYERDVEHRRPTGLPSARALHTKTMESLKSAGAFRPLIRAAFQYDVEAALRALKQKALLSTDGAAIRPDLEVLAFPPVEPLTCPNDLLDQRAARITAFLSA